MFDVEKEGGILISTYTMMSMTLKDNLEKLTRSGEIRKKIGEVPWGLVILDEV